MKYLWAFLCITTIVSCSTSRIVNTEISEDVDLSTYKTFDFYKLEASGDTLSRKFLYRTDLLKTAIANELVKKGYKQVSGNADLIVNIGITVKEKVQSRQTDFRTDAPRYIGQRRYNWKSKEVETGRYRIGTVDIHLVDSQKDLLVWRKVVEGVIPDRDKKLNDKIKTVIGEMFLDYPIAK